jgi:hypothetical protein
MPESPDLIDPKKDFRVRPVINMGVILNFEPEECFREDNPYGLGLIILESFKACFLRNPEHPTFIPGCKIRGLQPRYPNLYDGLVVNALGDTRITFRLAHLFHLLINEDTHSRSLLKDAANFCYIPTPEGRRRAFAVYVSEEGRWKLGADKINTRWQCRSIDQILTYVS